MEISASFWIAKLPSGEYGYFNNIKTILNAENSFYDATGSIGKRFHRQDKLRIDYDSLEDSTVILRD